MQKSPYQDTFEIRSNCYSTDRNYNRVFDAELKVGTTCVSHSKELVCSDTRLSHAEVSDSRAVAQAIV
jgi:hypothetical protein